MKIKALESFCSGPLLEASLSYRYPAPAGASLILAGFILLTVFNRQYERGPKPLCPHRAGRSTRLLPARFAVASIDQQRQ